MGRMLKKSLDRPDQRIDLEWVSADVVQMADASIARTEMRPGASCSRTTGGKSCPAHHAGFMVSGPGEILVSTTTYHLAAGAGLGFTEAGERELKGITGPRMLYAVTGVPAPIPSVKP